MFATLYPFLVGRAVPWCVLQPVTGRITPLPKLVRRIAMCGQELLNLFPPACPWVIRGPNNYFARSRLQFNGIAKLA